MISRIGFFEAAVGGFLVGVWFASMFTIGLSAIFLALLFCVVAFGFWKVYRRRSFLIVAIAFVFLSLGFFRYYITPVSENSPLILFEGAHTTFTGIVVEEPDIRDGGSRLTVDVREIGDIEVSGKVLLFTDVYPAYRYGDAIKVQGTLVSPGIIDHDGAMFDYGEYLSKDDVFYVVYRPRLELLGRGGNPIKRALFSIKRAFLGNINRVVPEPESALAGGLVVGGKQALGDDLLDDFKRTGLIHMVVLSGYNLTIVADTLMRLLARVPETFRLGAGAGVIVLFTIMTGAGPATVRAAIMAIIVMLARHRGRTFNATRALLFAAFFMILVSPKALVFDRGFQLSFIATMGLVYLSPFILARLTKIPETIWKLPLREVVASTIAAQIAVFPWILYTTGQVSIIALISNVLVLPLVPLTMLFVAATGFVGFVGSIASLPFAWISYLFLWYDVSLVRLLAKVPLGAIGVQGFPLWGVFLLYGVIGFLLFWVKRGKMTSSQIAGVL